MVKKILLSVVLGAAVVAAAPSFAVACDDDQILILVKDGTTTGKRVCADFGSQRGFFGTAWYFFFHK